MKNNMNFNNSTSRNFTLGIRGGNGGVGGLNNTNSASSSGVSVHQSIKYVYELPYLERKEIRRIFDENNLWETLGGGYMGYSSSELSEFGRAFLRGGSPTEALLNAWGSQNHTILELFTLFGRLGHFRAMKVIARFVDPKYHVYIRDPEVNATQELIQLDSPVSPVAVGAVGSSPGEHKVQNIGFHHHQRHPDSPKKLVDPGLHNKNDKVPEGGGKGASDMSSILDSVGHLPQIPYAELLVATNNWERRNILGKGGFGTVYKGVWKNTSVAIKRMEQRANHAYVESQMKQSLGELRCLNSCRHDNILPLYGFSLEGEHPCLVYQYMINGSLEDRLLCRQKSMPLNWMMRYQIVRGIACGIQFLHAIGPKPLIHGDIKSANILLDRNFEAKIGDFGLAREMPATGESYVKVSRVHGTRPYLPDEYLRSKKLSTKVDTYSFGVMLFEIATGQRAYEESRSKKFLRDVVEDAEGNYEPLRDHKGGGDHPDIYWHFIKIGRSCTEKLAKNRPEMVQVLKALDTFLSQQSTQASSIRTVSSQVTGIPFLFETPNSRPASLLIPAGSSTTHRLSPEMRATSPYWLPQSQFQPGYQTPPTISTNQSVHQQQISTASNHMKQNITPGLNYNIQQQAEIIRRSPLPSPSTNYPIPQMINNYGNGNSATPGMYQIPYQFQQQYQIPEMAPPPNLNIGMISPQSHAVNHIPLLNQATPLHRVRNSSQNGDSGGNSAVPPSPVAPIIPSVLPPNQEPYGSNPTASSIANPAGSGISKVAAQITALAIGQPQLQPNTQKVDYIGNEGCSQMAPATDAFLPVFLLEKQEDKKGKGDSIMSDDEDHNEWTNEQDGPATVIPLITELGIKDPQEQ